MNARTEAQALTTFDWDAYGRDVLAGAVPVCKWTRLAVERHYRDLATAAERGLWFSEQHAQHALESFLFLRHSKGEWAGAEFIPAPWQQFWLALAFGWMRKDGTRRFREVWWEVPRKNGKSTILAGVGLYLFLHDGEGGAEVYTAATKEEQAKITHSEAIRMVQRSPHLARHIGVRRDELYVPLPGHAEKYVPLGRDSKTMDGLNPHCGILDEVHAHPDRTIYDVLKSGMGARRQPMIWMITTAGFDLSSFGYEMHDYAKRVLEGTAQDDGFLGVVYTVDDPDNWDDPQEWAKANPNLGISVYHENLVEVVGRAKQLPSELANVKTKRLNIWLSGEMQWLDMPAWLKAADPNLKREDMAGLPNTLGLDLGDKRDPSALAHLFWRRENDGRLHWYCFLDTYIPEDEIDGNKNASYRKWVHEGWIQATPGNVTDQDRIEEDIRALAEQYNPQEIPFDPYQARQMSTHLVDEGVQMVELKPTVLNFSEPMKRLEEAVASGTFHHDGNPVLAWMLSNVVVEEDRKGNIYPRKQLPQNKIDGAVALVMALARALVHIDQGVSVYESWSRN